MKRKNESSANFDNDLKVGDTLLQVKDLTIHYVTKDMGTCRAVNQVNFDLKKGETLGLVGETGAGKTTIALSILGMVPDPPGKIISGNIVFKGVDLFAINKKKDAESARSGDIHDLSGSHDSVKSGGYRGGSDYRGGDAA